MNPSDNPPKRKIFCFLLFICVFIFPKEYYAQSDKTDSLLQTLKSGKSDTAAVLAHSQLCWIYLNNSQFPDAIQNGEKGLTLADALNYKRGKLLCNKNLGSAYLLTSEFDKALKYYEKALILAEDINDKKEAANCNGNIANAYYYKGDYKNALLFYEKQLKVAEQINDKPGMARSYNNLGNLYSYLNNYPRSLEYFLKNLNLTEKLGYVDLQASAYNNLGILYAELQQPDKATDYYNKALKIYQKLNDRRSASMTLLNIANLTRSKKDTAAALNIYRQSLLLAMETDDKEMISKNLDEIGSTLLDQGQSTQALENFLKSQEIKTHSGDKYGMCAGFQKIGTAYNKLADETNAILNYNKALGLALEIESPDGLRGAYKLLSDIHARKNNFREAYMYRVKFENLRDSFFNIDNSKILSDLKTNFEVEKVESELKAKAEARELVNSEEKKRQQFIIYSVAGVLILVTVFSVLLYKRFRITNKQKKIIEIKELETRDQNRIISQQKHLVEEKHREITDSINYAVRIQRSFLASRELLEANLKDYFIFFAPKDIVSGDFYWAANAKPDGNNAKNLFYLAVCDSTGHGVPGAIMSLLNISSLEKAIEIHKLPSEILNETRSIIINRLKKDGSVEGGKDGMDCSLLCFDFSENKLRYAAANNPVWIVRNSELLELNCDRIPVGKHERDAESFSDGEFELQKNDVVYTFTDGFADQFGGPKGKKYMYKKLKTFLVSISEEPMNVQKAKLDEELNHWKGNLEQVDDICIAGVRISS